MTRLLTCLFIVALTTACGWQLRGSSGGGVNLERIYVTTGNNHGPFITEFFQTLRAHRIALADEPANAQLHVVLSDETRDRRTAAVGSDALTSAFELVLTVEYSIFNAEGQPVVARDSARVMRTFDYTARSATSGAREENILISEMRRELSQLLIRRVEALAQHQPELTPTATPSSTTPASVPTASDHGQVTP
jgi:LPS-assembly lipoprotein